MSFRVPRHWVVRIAAALLLAPALPVAAQQGEVFADDFEPSKARSDADAARFLTQATFGPTRGDIELLRTVPLQTWIESQRALPATLARPALETYAHTLATGSTLSQDHRIDRWFHTAVTAPDQLRQRMAFALSQILVLSDQAAGLSGEEILVAEYQDLLARNAFGNFRTLLREVTYSPMMGLYLSHLRNRKTDWTVVSNVLTPSATAPDENYAREIMQLFSIGLYERALDGSLLPGPIATYSQDTISATARVFTGLAFAYPAVPSGCTGVGCNFSTSYFNTTPGSIPNALGNVDSGLVNALRYQSMVCYPRYHDTGRNNTNFQLLPNPPVPPVIVAEDIAIPAGPAHSCNSSQADPQLQQACVTYCDNSIDTVLDALFQSMNTAPFIARQLIQRFVTSNPSPGYIARIAGVFEDNGQGVRGDLGAVIQAILLDAEARAFEPAQADLGQPENFGKPREPLLKLTAIWRAFGAVSPDGRRWGFVNNSNLNTNYGQRPLGAPTVFNFYEPDFQQPGAIADAQLYSPEFQVLNETTALTTSNDLYSRICRGYGGATSSNCGSTTFAAPTDRAYIPPASLDTLPAASDALVEELNLRLMYGTMSGPISNPDSMQGVLKGLADAALAGDHRRKALLLIHLISISPEFSLQR